MPLSLSKVESAAPQLLCLAKKTRSALEIAGIDRKPAKGALIIDFSGSMRADYKNGSVQALTEKALAIATQLDDDGSIDLFFFDDSATYFGEVTIDNFPGVIEKFWRGRHMGRTNYANAFRAVAEHYGLTGPLNRPLDPHWVSPNAPEPATGLRALLRKTPTPPDPAHPLAPLAPLTRPADLPVFAIMVTDGAPDDRSDAVTVLTALSYVPIFWQFLSIGERIPFLAKLDELKNRFVDNAGYEPVARVADLTEDTLLAHALSEYPAWVKEQVRRGQIR